MIDVQKYPVRPKLMDWKTRNILKFKEDMKTSEILKRTSVCSKYMKSLKDVIFYEEKAR